MRKPLVFALIAVIVALGAATVVLYQKNQKTTVAFTEEQTKYAGAIDAIAEIQDSLNVIVVGDTTVEALSQRLETEQRLTQTQQEQAMARISIINASIQRTKARIGELEDRLSRSGVRVASLQKMVNNLKRSVTVKETQVADLSGRVDSLQTQVAGLETEVQANRDTIVAKDNTIEERRRELATVYYVVGTKKDLKDSGVLMTKGGVLGVGKTMALTGNYNENLFTAIDTDQQTVVATPAVKAEDVKVVSAQPAGSYELLMAGDKIELRIIDPVQFRKVKHLVIVTG